MTSDTIAELIATFIIGVMGTVFIGLIALFVYVILRNPFFILFGVGSFVFTFCVGWVLQNYDNFAALFKSKDSLVESKQKPPTYGIPVLDKLEYFEEKYEMSTVKFMSFVYDGVIPFKMDNLDYLEWFSLVNELALINAERGQGED